MATQMNDESRNDVLMQILTLAALIATIAFNSLSQVGRLGGVLSADVSNSLPTFITPATFAFSIWGVIYTLLIAFGIYQALPAQRANASARRIRGLVIINGVLNCLWLVAFHYRQFVLSVVVMLGILGTLILIYQRLGVDRNPATPAQRWLMHVPFSLYMGWISVATIVNFAALGTSLGYQNGFAGIDGSTWAAIMLVVGGALGSLLAWRGNIAFVLAVVWGFSAVYANYTANQLVSTTALVAIAVMLIVLTFGVIRGLRGGQMRTVQRAA